MTTQLHQALTRSPRQFTNYYAVDIAERLNLCPTQKQINAIEQILKRYTQALNPEIQHA